MTMASWDSITKGALEAPWVCYGKHTVSKISKAYQGVTGDAVAQSNCQNPRFSRYLRCLEYASSNQVVGGSNPFGRTFYQRSASAARAKRTETSRSNP